MLDVIFLAGFCQSSPSRSSIVAFGKTYRYRNIIVKVKWLQCVVSREQTVGLEQLLLVHHSMEPILPQASTVSLTSPVTMPPCYPNIYKQSGSSTSSWWLSGPECKSTPPGLLPRSISERDMLHAASEFPSLLVLRPEQVGFVFWPVSCSSSCLATRNFAYLKVRSFLYFAPRNVSMIMHVSLLTGAFGLERTALASLLSISFCTT